MSSQTTQDIVAAAREYAKRQWHVIQVNWVGPDGQTCSCGRGANCTSKGKHPIEREWQKGERPSVADVTALWDHKIRHAANVGLATGTPSGFWVLDIDPDHGGIESAKALAAEHGSFFAMTRVHRTGSGGYHLLFAMPDFEVTNSSKRLGPGLDVRGTGGQIVAPPSRTDKGGYAVARDVDPQPAPAWLLDLVRPVEHDNDIITIVDLPDRSHLDPAERERLDRYTARAVEGNLARLRELKEKGWHGEPWNITTFETACSLIELQNSPWNEYTTAGRDLFHGAPRDEAFDDDEVAKIWRSAQAKVGQKARPVPPGRPAAAPALNFFNGPDVRGREDPTEAGEAEDTLAGGMRKFFYKGKPLIREMAEAVLEQGRLAWGRDEAFWSYNERGVWESERRVVINRCVDLLGNNYRQGHASNVSDVVRASVPRIECAPTKAWINFPNGMLEWEKSDELVPHSPDFFSTVQLGMDWAPEAECPEFDKWLASILNPDYVDLTWEMLGYLMMSGNPLQVAFLLYGTGGNGKGTLIRVMKDLIGDGNYATETLDQLNSSRFSAVNLFGKIANLAGDIDGTYQESTASFKMLTGEDMYPAERKFGDRFNFESWAVPVFSANKIPGSADVSHGYLRRWVILHFERQITEDERIHSLSDRLIEELPGIAAKAVRSLRSLMARDAFDIKGEALRGKEMFAHAIDQVRQWLSECAMPMAGSYVSRDDLYANYKTWQEGNGHGRLRSQELFHRLEGLGYSPTDDGPPGYRGLQLLRVSKPIPVLNTTPEGFFP